MRTRRLTLLAVGLAALLASAESRAADHGDVPRSGTTLRSEANITDMHVFVASGDNGNSQEDRLVVALSMNQAIPPSAQSYRFPSDLKVRVVMDLDAVVNHDDPIMEKLFGGRVANPAAINADAIFTVTFDAEGKPMLDVFGLDNGVGTGPVRVYAGLRDDPFIRGPRQGRNVAAIVLEMPLRYAVKATHPTILVWATASVPDVNGPVMDYAGRALWSMFPEFAVVNSLPNPATHPAHGQLPDLVIFDTGRPAKFPNGRALTDDVVDMVGDARVLGNDAPFPSVNDRPFLDHLPYLADPHGAPAGGDFIHGADDADMQSASQPRP